MASGLQIGLNPCALVVLLGFFWCVSSARNPGMITSAALAFLVTTFLTNVLLTFGAFDSLVMTPAYVTGTLLAYSVIAVILIFKGVLHTRDWIGYKFKDMPVAQFRVLLPAFCDHAVEKSGQEYRLFVFRVVAVAFFLNMLGVAWGQDYALYISFSQIYFSMGITFAAMHMTAYFIGYLFPFVMLWIVFAKWGRFQGHASVSAPVVAFSKILQAALALSVGVILAVTIFRELTNS